MKVGKWMVILPIRELTSAKSRLKTPGRQRFALAFLRDVTEVLTRSDEVEVVAVVSPDSTLERLVPDCTVLTDPGTGIDPAIDIARAWAVSVGHNGPIIAMLPDLPSLRRQDFDAMLRNASTHDRSFVADSRGTGTTCVMAARPDLLKTGFGPQSAKQHRSWGYTELKGIGKGLRQDVDTMEDLSSALRLGTGPHTAACAMEQLPKGNDYEGDVRTT